MVRYSVLPVLLWVCLVSPLAGFAQDPETAQPESPVPEVLVPSVPQAGERLYGSVDFILWWLREGRVPPLLTTASPASAGILGQANTQLLYGDTRLETRHQDQFNGIRFNLGFWLDNENSVGVEGSAFLLERDSTFFKAVSDGSQVLARPFINALTGASASDVIAGPGPVGTNGGFVGYSRIEFFGEEANFVMLLLTGDGGRLELLAGVHFLQMRDRVDLTSTGHPLADPATLLGLTDHWSVEDHFWGGQLGLRGTVERGRWSLSLTGEVAPGATDATVHAFGDSSVRTPLVNDVTPFGLLVQPSNSGRFTHVEFDFVSEAQVNVACRLTSWATLHAGYTFLLWANAIRAGDQIDLVVNPTLQTTAPVGPLRPAIPFRTDTFWAQGVNVGLELQW